MANKYVVTFKKASVSAIDIEADLVEEGGKDGRWLDFYRTPVLGGRELELRVPTDEVAMIKKA